MAIFANPSPSVIGMEQESHRPAAKYSLQEEIETLWRKISEVDKKNYQTLEKIFYARYRDDEEKKHVRSIAEIFSSSVYSDDCKRYFAATHVSSVLILLLGDKFLTGEIILSYIQERVHFGIESSYVDTIMMSSHLSERIIATMFKGIGWQHSKQVLETTPDSMITAGLINSWVDDYSLGGTQGNLSFVAKRIRKAHPEYEGFPDEWVLKVFCGGS